MALASGTRLGPYEITASLGAGGMGEVYRATDTRLKRDVAVKVLPAEVAGDPERLARFQREAEVLASLNHPNIAGIYGLEETVSSGSGPGVATALVMELVEGPTLAERIAAGPTPPDEVLQIATQIAEGLEAAHSQGIVHRDLKPANVKLRPDGTVKVLDFGLAKPQSTAATPSSLSMAPTIAAPATTIQGIIVGTAAYMSPEQARGRPVDRRTDVWAFGAVLFEMLTGTRPFPGDDVSQVMARVIEREPDWTLLPPATPPGMRQAVEICLRKDLRERAGDLSAVRLAMQGAFVSAAATAAPAVERGASRGGRAIPMAAAAALVVGVAAGALGWSAMQPAPPAPSVERYEITTPPDGPLIANSSLGKVSISPDGTRIAYASAAGQGNASLQIYVRGIDQLEPTLLRGTEGGGTYPFFSPDGQSIGFVDVLENAIKRVPAAGGPAQTIAAFDRLPIGMEWAPDDTILFSLDRGSGLMSVPAGGGDVDQVTTLRDGDGVHGLPDVLPGGEHAVFTLVTADGVLRLAVVELATGEITNLGIEGSDPEYSPTGHIVYSAENTLRAVGFDADSLTLTTRAPVPVVENVFARGGLADFGLSANGSVVYLSGVSAAAPRTLVWMDRNARQETVGVPPRQYQTPRVSPDGTRVAVAVDQDIWVTELARPGTLRRLTTDDSLDRYPLWSRDGQRVFFESNRTAPPASFRSPPMAAARWRAC